MTPPTQPSPPPGGSQPSAASHPLTRSRSDRMIAGVAGGFARKYDFDPALVRVAFVMITVLSFGAAVLGYFVAWLVVPEADADEPVLSSAVRGARRRPFDRRLWIGLILLFLGAEALADQYGFRASRVTHVFWPLALIGVGASVLLLRERAADSPSIPPAPPSPPGPRGGTVPVAPPPAPPAGSGAPETTPVAENPSATGVGVAGAPLVDDAPPSGPPPTAYPPSIPWPDPARPRAPRRVRRERSMLGRLTWSALLIVVGAAWLLDVVGATHVDARFVLALELAVVGVALLVGTWVGRSRGLIALGLLLTVFAGAFSVLDIPLNGPIGESIVRPSSMSTVHSSYRLGIGHLELDLRGAVSDGHAHRVKLTDAIGFIEVFVPADARVEVISRTDTGSLELFGGPQVGGTHKHRTVLDEPVGTSGPLLVIDAHVGFGSINVSRDEGFTS